MNNLNALYQHILTMPGFITDKLDFYAVDCEMELSGSTADDPNEITFCHVVYDAVYDIEGYSGSAAELMAHISTWCMNHGDEMTQGSRPKVDVEPADNGTFNIEIIVSFSEPIKGVKDDNGKFELHGACWSLGESELWTAESFELMAQVDDGGSTP